MGRLPARSRSGERSIILSTVEDAPLPKVDAEKWRQLLSHWASADCFDGIRGQLPDWVPTFRRREFSAARARAATFAIAQGIGIDSLVQQIQRAAERPAVNSIALLMNAKTQGWLIDGRSLLTLVDMLHAVSRGEKEGLAYLTDGETARHIGREIYRRAKLQAMATQPRPNARALPDAVVQEIAKRLTAEGVPPRQLVSQLKMGLEQKGIQPPTSPTMRHQLQRLGFLGKKQK
ncbi:MAG TPA: hypothetical protein VFB08_02145 [Burkholderiales bacterium]|nr:hypothetical protein [Burkholderiales bacterium]